MKKSLSPPLHSRRCGVAIATLLSIANSLSAQVPNPVRAVHRAIADPAPGLSLPSSPHFAAADNLWNNGEGFVGGSIDHGGWADPDDGTGLTIADVHECPSGLSGWTSWQNYTWSDPLPPFTPTTMHRFVGYLRPSVAGALPTVHPLYGAVGSYVDQGAFEVFTPTTALGSNRKILVCILCRETLPFPPDFTGTSVAWGQTYRGFFSPDGLCRPEKYLLPRSVANFQTNNGANSVDRPGLSLIGSWDGGPDYWPILAYPVLTVPGRSTTLNEQRHLQVARAIKCMLQQSGVLNPLGSSNALTAQQVEERVVVCFVGGSNGGHQAHWSTLMHPKLVHGCYAEVINPSLQRLFGEHDLCHELARLAGAGVFGATVREGDFLLWDQYAWARGLEVNDISYPRLLAAGATYRPACFVAGDEDITSTGNDWVRPVGGGAWTTSGLVHSSSTFGSATWNTVAWMVAENACHTSALVPVTDPYTNLGNQYIGRNSAHGLFEHAVLQQHAAYAAGQQNVPQPPAHVARSSSQSFYGLDDPQEWFLGRPGGDLPPTSPSPLLRDDVWCNAVQPGAAGTVPGAKDAMLIRDGHLYVGCAEGYVTKFDVDQTLPEKPLVRVAQSPKLGNDAFALAATQSGGSWSLVVGTRRHLYKLNPTNLSITSGPIELPWEVAQPRHMHVADVLTQSPGDEVLFHSVHGGLVFYRAADLVPVYEWPEPGISDFEVSGPAVTILSFRGVLANVTFPWNGTQYVPQLQAVSSPKPNNYAADLPCQGQPRDLSLMTVNWSAMGGGTGMAAISSWSGDSDGNAVRGHFLANLMQVPYLANLSPIADIATCKHATGYMGGSGPGDHALILSTDALLLYDQYGQFRAGKLLTESQRGYYSFGAQAHALVVGELAANTGGEYSEEVVVATNTGLMWLHVDDLLTPGFYLPAAYDLKTTYASGTTTHIQPHTNRSMAATWAMYGDPVTGLNVLDQRGNYWLVDANGAVTLRDREYLLGARGWDPVGMPSGTPLSMTNYVIQIPASPSPPQHWPLLLGAQSDAWRTLPWCPRVTELAVYEKNGAVLGTFLPNNWQVRESNHVFFAGHIVHPLGGCSIPTFSGSTPTGHELWFWRDPTAQDSDPGGPWGNMLEGMHLDSSGSIDGIWASTHIPVGAGLPCPYHAMRTVTDFIPAMTEQCLQAVKLTQGAYAGKTAVVLGCPGGRVRVVLPGLMRTSGSTPHDVGTMDSSQDFGFGGSALAVRLETDHGEDVLRIWFGVIVDPPPRPGHYSNATGVLDQAEVAAGAVHMMTWTPGGGFTLPLTKDLKPTVQNLRGASGVIGLKVADLLPGASHPGDELIVGTLSGDLIVYQADTMVEIWRTHVPGAVGFYNSIVVEDLDGDSLPELYVAGSWGLWRFKQ